MRSLAIATVLSLAVLPARAGPQDEFAKQLAGPWGRVDVNWQPYSGVLAKNSCPAAGVRQPSTVGLFGDGGSMWIEADAGGALRVYEGGSAARTFAYVRMETASSVVYRADGLDRRLALVGPDRLSEERLPAVSGLPGTKYVRCKRKT